MAEKNSKYATEVTSDFVKFGTEADAKVYAEANPDETAVFVEELEGVLMASDSIIMQGKPVGKYKLETENGDIVAFLGTVILDDKLSVIEIGTDIRIELAGSQKSRTPGHSPTRQFRVFKAE